MNRRERQREKRETERVEREREKGRKGYFIFIIIGTYACRYSKVTKSI